MKQVLITGASSGIGAACARQFSQQGWKVFLLGRSLEKLKSVQSQLKNPSEVLAFDLHDSSSFSLLQNRLKELKSDISALVNNAGVFQPAAHADDTDKNWSTHFAVNVLAPVHLTRILWPELKKNKGSVTNVSSTLGTRSLPNTAAYSASKAALNSWTQTLALEAAPLGIRVNSVCPGLVDTPIHAFHSEERAENKNIKAQLASKQPMGRLAVADDIAHVVYFTATSEAAWMSGAILPVDGAMSLTMRDS